MSKLKDKVVFITGASSGIGEALAREASAQGAHVVLSARREDRVRAIADELVQAGGQTLAVRVDVTQDGSLEAAMKEVATRFGRLDMVIANAGFGVEGKITELSLEDYRRQLETNVFGVVRTIYAALPLLKESQGTIGVMGSANGYLNVPGWSAYCMSKHAVRSLCTSLLKWASGLPIWHPASWKAISARRATTANSSRTPRIQYPSGYKSPRATPPAACCAP
jgi:NADP-dependent 3-hydroxy acid dehydrogenase YdfG